MVNDEKLRMKHNGLGIKAFLIRRSSFVIPHCGRGFRIAGLSLLGIAGIAGAALAFQHFFTNHIVRAGQEQRLIVRINAPYGSMSLHPGTAPTDVARIESNDQPGESPSYYCRYFVRNQTLGILHLGIGTDEGLLEQPPLAMWRAKSDISLASTMQPQSDMGRTGSVKDEGGKGMKDKVMDQLSLLLIPPSLFRPHFFFRPIMPFAVISTDAATMVKPIPESGSDTRVFLTKDIPMDFHADLGFGESLLDLSGLPIINMNVETGASRATIFSHEPNPRAITICQVSAGLGECSFTGISNLNAYNFVFQGGVGSYHLGFEGHLNHNLDAHVSVGLGMCSISIPPTAGRVQIFYDDGLLSSYSFSGLAIRHSGYATSVGFNNSTSPVLTLYLSSAMGKMTVSYH